MKEKRKREYTESELIFKEKWVNKAMESLNRENDEEFRDKLSRKFDTKYRQTDIEIENTESADTHLIPAVKFFLNVGKRFILNENGTLTWKHKFKLGVLAPIIANAIKIRQITKKAKVRAAEVGDYIHLGMLSNKEYALKIVVNGLYGLFLYTKSIFFNASIGAATTAAGRAIIAVAMLTVESIGGGFRSYVIDAHLQLINNCKKDSERLNKAYTLPMDLDVETVLKHLLLDYYDTYYFKSFLRDTLSQLTKEELAVVYLRNNYNAFIQVPEVRNLITYIYSLNRREEGELSEKDERVLKDAVREFGVNPDYKKSYMCYYAKHPKFKKVAADLKTMSAELLVGFFYYNGDWYNGIYHQTHVEVAENIDRKKVPTLDTDSTVTSLFDEVEALQYLYKDAIGDDDEFVHEIVTAVIATVIYGGAITYSLHRYASAIGVGDKYVHLVEMEEETLMHDLNITTNKKQYIFNSFIQDGNYTPDTFSVIHIKGLPIIKSDYNSNISEKVTDIFSDNIMVRYNELDYKNIIVESKKLTDHISEMLKSDDYILNKSTVKKSNKSSEELAYGDSKNKMRRLWNKFGLPSKIEFPGSYKEIEVKFTVELLKTFEDKYPVYYNAFVEHVREIKMFEMCRSCINEAIKMLDNNGKISFDEIDVIDPNYSRVIREICTRIKTKDTTQHDEECSAYIFNRLFYDGVDPAFVKVARKVFNLGPKEIIMDITNEDIISYITKIGIPVDLTIIPEFFKVNDYELVDNEFAATGEFLLGSLVDTIGINCPRNKSKNMMVSSALQTY